MKLLIDTEWATFLEDLSTDKQLEFFWAVFDYGKRKCTLKCWEKIFPELEKGKIKYYNKLNNLKQYKTERVSESVSESVPEREPISEYKYKTEIEYKNKASSISTTRAKEENKTRVHNALEIFGNTFKGVDAVVGIFDRPDGTKREGIQIKNPHLMAFVKSRFDKKTLEKVSDWAIDHNQRGHTYNAAALIKLLCKFQSNIEPTINFNHVQSEYLTFEQQR